MTITSARKPTWSMMTDRHWGRPLTRVISGGQTGAEQAALFTAQAYRIPTGGWVPEGWQEAVGPNSGLLADRFGLHEQRGGHAQSLRANILDSDGTLSVANHPTEPYERLCRRILDACDTRVLELRLDRLPPVQEVAEWIVDSGIHALHIIGAREGSRPPRVFPVCLGFFANLFCTLGYVAEPNALASLGVRTA
jgi:hypothetical protein